MKSFDRVAPWYRWLEWLRFGGLLQKARLAQLESWQGEMPKRVLVLGDGDGRFAAEASARWPNAALTLVDASARMMALAEKRLASAGNVTFRVQPIQAYLDEAERTQRFDLIVSHFFLDCFEEATLRDLMPRLVSMLSDGGQWLVTDFQPHGTCCQRVNVWLMIRFFRLTTGMEASTLPGISKCLEDMGLKASRGMAWASGWIRSDLWQTDCDSSTLP